jgi:ABC-2 type transport system ATP-binding protein
MIVPAVACAPMEEGGAAMVVAESLHKRYGDTHALSGLSFTIAGGEVVGLLGPNGAGKTTTLKILLGLVRPTSGEARILGLDCTAHAREVKERIGYCPDEPAFYDYLTGRETLDFVARMRGMANDDLWAHVRPLVERFDFAAQLDVLTHNYSHGMKKKLALLCAIAHGPRVLLLDEPTNGLDPQIAHEVRRYLGERAAAGVAVLVSTHLLDMADRLCGRMLILNKGHLLAEGEPQRVRAQAGVAADDTLEAAFLRLCA